MSTPYVYLQGQIIRMLQHLLRDKKEKIVRHFLEKSRLLVDCGGLGLDIMKEISFVYPHIFHIPEDMTQDSNSPEMKEYDWLAKEVPKIIIEQLDDSGDQLEIRNILGLPLHRDCPVGIEGYLESRFSGRNTFRIENRFAQPAALQVGDILATGETVIHQPREGGNGSILVKLNGDIWLNLPARVAVALYDPESMPPEILERR